MACPPPAQSEVRAGREVWKENALNKIEFAEKQDAYTTLPKALS